MQQYVVDEFLLYGNGRYKFNVKLIRSIDFGHIKAQMNCDIVRQIHICYIVKTRWQFFIENQSKMYFDCREDNCNC